MIIAVDTGGTKTLIAEFNDSIQPRSEIKFPTPKNPDDYIAKLKQVLTDNFTPNKADAIIIAVPGMVKNNIAVWCANLDWRNFDIAGQLKDDFSCPIWLENDANLAGLGETLALDSIPDASLYVTVSTGIGTGIILDGKIDDGLNQSEGGHMPVEYNGKVSEWESFASGQAIVEIYHKYAREITDEQTWHEIADRISRGFLVLIPLLQPEIIIIGGSIGTYFERYIKSLESLIQQSLPSDIPLPKFVQAAHPEAAVIYGCYHHAKVKLSN